MIKWDGHAWFKENGINFPARPRTLTRANMKKVAAEVDGTEYSPIADYINGALEEKKEKRRME